MGFCLINALPIILSLSLATLLILFFKVKSIRLLSLQLSHSRGVHDASNNLLEDVFRQTALFLPASPNQYLVNTPFRRQLDSIGITSTIQFPLFDLTSVFNHSRLCNENQRDRARSILGRSLTESSLVSETTCLDLNTSQPIAASYGNLSLLGATPSPIITLIASIGYLEIEDLVIDHAITLFAGGDLEIHAVSTVSTAQLHLIAVSTTGKVKFNSIAPNIIVHPIARVGLFIPPGVSAGNPVLNTIPILREEILGIRRDTL